MLDNIFKIALYFLPQYNIYDYLVAIYFSLRYGENNKKYRKKSFFNVIPVFDIEQTNRNFVKHKVLLETYLKSFFLFLFLRTQGLDIALFSHKFVFA